MARKEDGGASRFSAVSDAPIGTESTGNWELGIGNWKILYKSMIWKIAGNPLMNTKLE